MNKENPSLIICMRFVNYEMWTRVSQLIMSRDAATPLAPNRVQSSCIRNLFLLKIRTNKVGKKIDRKKSVINCTNIPRALKR